MTDSAGIYDLVNAEFGKNNSASVAFSKSKAAYSARDFKRTLSRWNVPLKQHPNHPIRTVNAGRLLWACPDAQRPTLSHALYKAYWVDNLDVSSISVLQNIVDSVVPELQMDVQSSVDDERNKDLLRKATEEAVKRGTPGVPAIFVPDSRLSQQGRMFWGGDRIHFVEGALASLDQPTPEIVPVPMPRFTRGPLMRPRTLRMWFDFSSPWTYLGWTQVSRILEEAGPLCTLELKPTLLGIVFQQIGTPVVPSLVVSKQKREYSGKDLALWVEYWSNLPYPVTGERKRVRFQFNTNFPLRTPIALRMVTAVQAEGASLPEVVRLINVLFQACWADNVAVSDKDPEPLVAYLQSKSFDGRSLLEKARSATANETLRRNTAEAVSHYIMLAGKDFLGQRISLVESNNDGAIAGANDGARSFVNYSIEHSSLAPGGYPSNLGYKASKLGYEGDQHMADPTGQGHPAHTAIALKCKGFLEQRLADTSGNSAMGSSGFGSRNISESKIKLEPDGTSQIRFAKEERGGFSLSDLALTVGTLANQQTRHPWPTSSVDSTIALCSQDADQKPDRSSQFEGISRRISGVEASKEIPVATFPYGMESMDNTGALESAKHPKPVAVGLEASTSLSQHLQAAEALFSIAGMTPPRNNAAHARKSNRPLRSIKEEAKDFMQDLTENSDEITPTRKSKVSTKSRRKPGQMKEANVKCRACGKLFTTT
ncbi:hypothetical protein HDU93_009041 [Gonapodya sp. JEL0774]|nr:hypothetical protein HDU93_009041 [Gonapodya sp. JEL0774]